MPAGRPQGPGPNGSPNGDRKPAPGAGWWPCLHTRWPVSADKAIRGPGLRGSASQMPPTPTAPSRCAVFTSCVRAGGGTRRVQTADDDRSRSCVACPGARRPREGEAIPPSATGAGVDLAGGAVAVGEGPHRRHRCTLTAEGPPPGRPPRHARPRGSGARGRRRARSCGAQDWTGSRTCRGQGHGTSVRCFKVKMNVKHRGGREFQKLPRRAARSHAAGSHWGFRLYPLPSFLHLLQFGAPGESLALLALLSAWLECSRLVMGAPPLGPRSQGYLRLTLSSHGICCSPLSAWAPQGQASLFSKAGV